MPLPLRKLGSQGCEASALGLGCMSLTPGLYDAGGLTEGEAAAVIQRAQKLGVTLFNTSDLYGPYTNEELLGRALGEHKHRAVIATKWGPMLKDGGIVMDASRENCRRCCEGSLARLGVPAINIFTMRGPVDPKIPLEETMAEIKALVDEGKVKYVGLSEVGPEEVRRAHAVVPITCVELEWSLFTRDAERDLVPACRELGIGILAYSPLGRGLLAGRFNNADELGEKDFRRHGQPRFQGDNFAKNMSLAEEVRQLAVRKGCTPGQLALAWLLKKGDDIVPIPGTKSVKRLDENCGAAAVELTDAEVAELEAAVPEGAVAGDRYQSMHLTYHTYHVSGKATAH